MSIYTIKKIFSLLLIAAVINSCNTIKMLKSASLLAKANVSELKAPLRLPYKNTVGLVGIDVNIKGKVYHFIFDTGAGATVISKQAADAIGINKEGEISTNDSQGASQKMSVGYIDTIFIGSLMYTKVGAVINDFSKTLAYSCLGIDGIIGVNILYKNNWQINFEENTFVVSNINRELNLSSDFKSVPFKLSRNFACFDFTIENKVETFRIDMGMADKLQVSKKIVLSNPFATEIGLGSIGLFGSKQDTINFYKTTLVNPSITISNEVITQSNTAPHSLIGKGYFEKYYSSIVFDFSKNTLFVKDKSSKTANNYSYGFGVQTVANALIVASKKINFSQEINSLSVGDTIVGINEITSGTCAMQSEYLRATKNKKTITLTISENKKSRVVTLLPKEE